MRTRITNALRVAVSCSLVLSPAMPMPCLAADIDEEELVAQAEDAAAGDEGDEPAGTEVTAGKAADEAADSADGLPAMEDAVEIGGEQEGKEAPATFVEGSEAEDVEPSEEATEAEDTSKPEDAQKSGSAAATADDGAKLTAQSSSSQADTLASKHANTIPNGTYTIASMTNTSKVLDVRRSSKADGATLIIWTSKNVSNQYWQISNVSGGYVTIKCGCSGKYLQAGHGGKADAVVQATRNSSNRGQLWIACLEGGSLRFVPATDTSRTLCVSGGNIQVMPTSRVSSSSAHWKLHTTEHLLDSLAAAHKNDLANGAYVFKSSVNASLCMEVTDASMDNSTLVKLNTKTGLTDQGWIVSHDSKGYVILVNARSGRALDVRGRVAAPGTQIIQWTKKQGFPRNQRWIAIKRADGSYSLVSALVGEALACSPTSTKKGASVKLAMYGSGGIQRWRVEKEPRHFANVKDIADGEYVLRTCLDTNKALDVQGNSAADNALVKLWTLKNSNNQVWVITHDLMGYLYLRNKNSGLYLAYRNNRLCQSRIASSWVFEQASGGGYYVRNVDTGKYLDVRRSNTNNSTNQLILYTKGSGKNQHWQLASPTIGKNTRIMGTATVSQAQAVRYVKQQLGSRTLPKKWRNNGETVEKIVKYFYEEGAAEGVRADVALAQSLHETNVFQFTGDVVPEQYNFAGIGTTGGGVRGNYFKNARTGVLAQIQHLKAYASTQPLNKYCVDPRFDYVTRGRAVTIAGLTNTWAIDSSYANALVARLNAMMKA